MRNTAFSICQRLQNAGYEAVFAGGAVRDMLLGHLPDDIDIATNAKPEEIENIFEKSFSIGKHFGVVIIVENEHHFEIATFRSDSGYSDGRRPDAVMFTNMQQDALRRDFTINALFWDPISEKLFDFGGGQDDLKNKILRFVGNPSERIQEDFLRIMRAIRFKNRFSCSYHIQTQEALSQYAFCISKVSGERIRSEIEKMILHPSRVEALQDLQNFGILEQILPEVSQLSKTVDADGTRTVSEHTLACLATLPENISKIVAWSVLFHDIGKAKTFHHDADRNRFPLHQDVSEELFLKIASRLQFSRLERNTIAWLIKNHIRMYTLLQMKKSHQLQFFDHPFFPWLIEVCRADALGHDGNASLVEKIEQEYRFAESERLLPQFSSDLLNGLEIQEILQIPAGKKVGQIKALVREAQISGNLLQKNQAVEFVKNISEHII